MPNRSSISKEPFRWKKLGSTWYGPGIFHVTMATKGRKPIFGALEKRGDEYVVKKTDIGWAMVHNLTTMVQMCPEVQVVADQVMPDHFHLVLYLRQRSKRSVRQIIRGYMQGCRAEAGRYGVEDMLFDAPPFIRSLAHKGQLQTMIAYVKANPRRAWIKRENPDLFSLKRNIGIDIADGALEYSALGNIFLLDYPVRQLVKCSRNMSIEEIEGKKHEALTYAQNHGVVTYTAAISEGEKQIARAIRATGYPLVILLKDGFPKEGSEHERYFKPGGVYYEACAEGKLLLLEPKELMFEEKIIKDATYEAIRKKALARGFEYVDLPTTSSRYRFMALNEMGRLLVER